MNPALHAFIDLTQDLAIILLALLHHRHTKNHK